MKSWRMVPPAALLALAASPVLAVSPAGPMASAKPASPASSGPTVVRCEPDLTETMVFPVVMCVERQDTSSSDMSMLSGNIMPWTNSGLFALGYRNQYLYPSTAVVKVASKAVTLESIHSRAVSFSGVGVNDYSGAGAQWVQVYNTPNSSLNMDFNSNQVGPLHLDWQGPKTITHISGVAMGGSNPSPAALSDFISRGPDPQMRNMLDTIFDFRLQDPNTTNILVDGLMRPGVALSTTMSFWDVTQDSMGTGCDEPRRAFGGRQIDNPNYLTTALTIDNQAFVWVFKGKALPPPATIQQQIAEILRLLVTPEALRCTGIDLNSNGRLEDNPLQFPNGANFDPISPQVTSGGTISGEETHDGAQRQQGWVE